VIDKLSSDVALIDGAVRTGATDNIDANGECDAEVENVSVDVLATPEEMDAALLNRQVHTWTIETPSLNMLFM
jgi:hypothetical protein